MERPHTQVALILARDLAAQLATPILLVDAEGSLVYFNEPAEHILGRSWTEAGELSADDLRAVFKPRTLEGETIPPEEGPLSIAVLERRPAHRTVRIMGMDGVDRGISVTAIPLMTHPGEMVGAVAIFWNAD